MAFLRLVTVALLIGAGDAGQRFRLRLSSRTSLLVKSIHGGRRVPRVTPLQSADLPPLENRPPGPSMPTNSGDTIAGCVLRILTHDVAELSFALSHEIASCVDQVRSKIATAAGRWTPAAALPASVDAEDRLAAVGAMAGLMHQQVTRLGSHVASYVHWRRPLVSWYVAMKAADVLSPLDRARRVVAAAKGEYPPPPRHQSSQGSISIADAAGLEAPQLHVRRAARP